MAVTVKINDKKLAKAIQNLTKKLENMTPAFKDIADLELSETKLRFKDQVDPQGIKWANSVTIRRDSGGSKYRPEVARRLFLERGVILPGWHFFNPGMGDKILRDTGQLYKSLGRAYGPDYAIVGTDKEYANDVQNGGGKRIARPFLGINERTLENVRFVSEKYIKGVLK